MSEEDLALAQLKCALIRVSPLSEESWESFSKHWEYTELAEEECLHKVGEPAEKMAYVFDGMLREYFLTRDGTEYNKAFVFSGEFSGSLFDLLSGEPSTATVQAIKPCRMLVASYENVKHLYDEHECLQRLGRVIIENLFIKKAQREYEFLTMDATTRYQKLVSTHPEFEEKLPQYHLASYLGITPVALSRIRASLKKI